MTDPLLDQQAARARPSWTCWRAHVRLVTFCLRYSFMPGDDETVDRLVKEFLAFFHATYPESYFKPKHHMIEHLGKYLRLFGPFRQTWTLPQEAFLLHLKQLCEATNWKAVPFMVSNNWARGRALSFAMHARCSCLSLDVQPASDCMMGSQLLSSLSSSPCMRALAQSPDHMFMQEARYLRFVGRDGVEMRIGA
jgi:hypothetical protein